METALKPSYFTNFLTDSSSSMVGEFAFEEKIQQEPNLTLKDDRLKLFLDRWHGMISVYFENWIEEADVLTLPLRLSNPLYGQDILDNWINEKARYAPTIERVREITAKLPSLTKLLLDDRNNE